MKKALIIRLGAIGDSIMITPVIQRLKDLGYYIILNTSTRGLKVFKDDARIDEFIDHDESISNMDVQAHWDKLVKEVDHDLFINFSESIEINVALHPKSPMYVYPKKERAERCNKNYYEVTAEWSKLDGCSLIPSLKFTEKQHKSVQKHIKPDMFNILWCLSGSGKNKVYPWTDYVIEKIIKKYPNVHFITTGDMRCQILEDWNNDFPKNNLTQLAGRMDLKESMLLTQYADLFVGPDTGLLHASGCFETPKIGLLGHTTKENITKHFINDYSIEAKCDCSPCFRLIYDYEVQCPIDPDTGAAWCMAKISPELVIKRIEEVMNG